MTPEIPAWWYIDDWEFPPPPVCEVCGKLLRNHWRGRPCLKPDEVKDEVKEKSDDGYLAS